MSMHPPISKFQKSQRGISLLVVLILLLVMSVLGVAVLRSSAMQERMSANMYDRSLALQAAEQALNFARTALDTDPDKNWRVVVPDSTDCSSKGICPTFTKSADATWMTGPTIGGSGGVPETRTQYWIEYLGMNQTGMEIGGVIPASETTSLGPMFRITARSRSDGRADVTLQSDVILRIPRL